MTHQQMNDFFILVRRMRAAQRAWFKTKEKKYLIEAKQAEMQVDLELPAIMDYHQDKAIANV